jgi:hypothetical protein
MCLKTLEEKEKMFKVPYDNVVDSLMYAMMCTHPDICYVVRLVSRYQSNDDSQKNSTISERNFKLHIMLARKERLTIDWFL